MSVSNGQYECLNDMRIYEYIYVEVSYIIYRTKFRSARGAESLSL